MFKKSFGLLLVGGLLLSSCQKNDIAPDGYTYYSSEFKMNKVEITLVTHSSLKDLRISAANEQHLDIDSTSDIVAYSILKAPYTKCEVHIVEPEVSYMPQYLGHEALHCFRGQWHKDNNTF